MKKFENASVIAKANIYFDGKVTSRTIELPSGEKKTLGIMLPGEYEFGTEYPELMEILQGKLEVLLPGNDKHIEIQGGEQFNVPGNAKFELKVSETTDYICTFLSA